MGKFGKNKGTKVLTRCLIRAILRYEQNNTIRVNEMIVKMHEWQYHGVGISAFDEKAYLIWERWSPAEKDWRYTITNPRVYGNTPPPKRTGCYIGTTGLLKGHGIDIRGRETDSPEA